MARRLDHSKGGNYTPDPARAQRSNDFVIPDAKAIHRKQKSKRSPSVWLVAIKSLWLSEIKKCDTALTQKDLLAALGITKKEMRSKHRGAILKRLVNEGLILGDGTPNLDHPKVVEIISNARRA